MLNTEHDDYPLFKTKQSLDSFLFHCPCRLDSSKEDTCNGERGEEGEPRRKRTSSVLGIAGIIPPDKTLGTSALSFQKVRQAFLERQKRCCGPVSNAGALLCSLLMLIEIQDNRQFLHLFVLFPKPGNLGNSSVPRSINTCFNFSINFGKNADIVGLVFLIFENLPNSPYTLVLCQLSILGEHLPCIEKVSHVFPLFATAAFIQFSLKKMQKVSSGCYLFPDSVPEFMRKCS